MDLRKVRPPGDWTEFSFPVPQPSIHLVFLAGMVFDVWWRKTR